MDDCMSTRRCAITVFTKKATMRAGGDRIAVVCEGIALSAVLSHGRSPAISVDIR